MREALCSPSFFPCALSSCSTPSLLVADVGRRAARLLSLLGFDLSHAFLLAMATAARLGRSSCSLRSPRRALPWSSLHAAASFRSACSRSVVSRSVCSTSCHRTPTPLTSSSVPCPWLRARVSLFGYRHASSSVGLTSHRCPICVSTRPWSCSSSSSMLCCRFDCRRCCVPRCMLAGCRLLYLSTRACLWLALTLARLLVVTAAHSLFIHRASRVLAFVVELLNPSSLARDFVIA
jgi:hypothetical protein